MSKLGLLVSSLVCTVLALAVVISYENPAKALGSVNIANEYKATTTDATWSTATAAGDCKDTLVGSATADSYKTLGSIVVTKTSNATLFVYDATTTKSHSHHPTTTLVAMPLTTVGTYTFDVSAQRGVCVVIDTAVGVASTTITYR